MNLTGKLPIEWDLVGKGSSLFFLLFLVGCSFGSYVEINNNKINIELADNELERAKGLMFRESLCEDCGMLFMIMKTIEVFG